MRHWLFLIIAVIFEVVATSSLPATKGFTRLAPSLVVVAGYAAAFYFLSLTLRTIPVGIAYAIWSGLGVALVTVVGWLHYGQRLDPAGFVGIALIVTGVAVLNLFSKVTAH